MDFTKEEFLELRAKGYIEIGVKGEPGEPGIPFGASEQEKARILRERAKNIKQDNINLSYRKYGKEA